MDSKKVLERLLKIASNQQKIIMKLAQQQGLPPDSLPNSQFTIGDPKPRPVSTTPPQHMDPNKPILMQPGDLILSCMMGAAKNYVSEIRLGPPIVGGARFDVKVKPSPSFATDKQKKSPQLQTQFLDSLESAVEKAVRDAQQKPGSSVPSGEFTITTA